MSRPITNDDLWAAIRGLGMTRMSYRELEELRYEHAHPDKPFASHVIAEAARQMQMVQASCGRLDPDLRQRLKEARA